MVIDDLDIERVSVLPFEADAPLLINADAVLALAITFQPFELIRRRNHQIAQIAGTVQILQSLARSLLDPTIERSYELTLENRLGVLAPEGPDHRITITLRVINVKR
jgi:hypothetical protein